MSPNSKLHRISAQQTMDGLKMEGLVIQQQAPKQIQAQRKNKKTLKNLSTSSEYNLDTSFMSQIHPQFKIILIVNNSYLVTDSRGEQ